MAGSMEVRESRQSGTGGFLVVLWKRGESIPSLKDEQKAALEAFKRKFALHKWQRSCTDMLFTSLPRRTVITSYASLIWLVDLARQSPT